MASKHERRVNPIIQSAKAHMDALGVRQIEVPEWPDDEGKPLVIYATPMTLAERNRIGPKADRGDLTAYVDVIVMKAKDADGEKLFTLEDKQALRSQVDSAIVTRIALEILTSASVEDQLGN